MGWIFAYWRRFFGGYDSKYDWLEKRGIQCVFITTLVFLWEYFEKNMNLYNSFIIAILVYIFFSKSHYYYFLCGTESDEYIDEQEAKGRKPAMNWIVAPINKWLGFIPRSKQYCFIGLFIRYVFWSIPVSFFVGFHFTGCAMAIPFIYNAMFWVELPNTKFCKCPTNWAEMFSGLVIGYGLY